MIFMSIPTPTFKETCYEHYRSELVNTYPENLDNPYMRRLIHDHIPPDRKSRICDLGCGEGRLLWMLEGAGYSNIEGVDRSPFQVGRRVHHAVQFRDGLEHLQHKPDSSLDVAIAFDVIEHLRPEELLQWMHELNRVLLPTGRLIIHTANGGGLFGSRSRYADLTHDTAFTAGSLGQLAEIGGFRSIGTFEDKPVIHGLKSCLRRVVWDVCRLPFLLMWTAETGTWRQCILSQNILAVFYK